MHRGQSVRYRRKETENTRRQPGGGDTLPGGVAGKRFACRARRSDLAGYTYHLEAGRFFGK
jgi:hypothetical protein